MPAGPTPSTAELDNAVLRLGVRPDGTPFRSLSSLVCPVTFRGRSAFLKVSNEPEELAGARALEVWNGHGAVRLLARDGNAMLFERAGRSLRSIVTDDAVATQKLCAVADRLHRHSPRHLDGFPSLRGWFSALFADTNPRFDQARILADRLLRRPARPMLLHGDLHHENVLDGATRGWLAIDPKGIVGAREFDYCNIFTNWTAQQAVDNFDSRLHIVATAANIAHADLLRWVAAWSALSGIWHLEDGEPQLAAFPHSIMDLALNRLPRAS